MMIERPTAAVFLLVKIISVSSSAAPWGAASAAEPASGARRDLDSTSMLQTVVRPPPEASVQVVSRATAAAALPDVLRALPELQGEALGAPGDTNTALAWQVAAASAMATSEARLGVTSVLLLMLAGLRLTLQARQKEPRLASAALAVPEPSGEEPRAEADEEPAAEEPVPAAPVPPPLPPPRPRLQLAGASFAAGDVRAAGSRGPTLNFDIPSTPAGWPLRAVLSRPKEDGPWSGLELTVDIAAACELPPLLACTPASCVPHTGGTPFLGGTGACPPDAGPGDEDTTSAADSSPWLFMHNGGGHLVASVARRPGGCQVRHHDGLLWEIELEPEADANEPWVTVTRLGQPIGQAVSFQRGGEMGLRLETLPEAKSPESALLLTCMLAMAAFSP